MNSWYRFLADVVVVAHAAYVAFVVFGLLAILVGIVRRWAWVRNFWFRAIHLAMIAVVVAEALIGIICPLTIWEHRLREAAGESIAEGTFIGRWTHELIFVEAPQWVLTIVYCLFGAVVLATFLLAPPRWPWRRE